MKVLIVAALIVLATAAPPSYPSYQPSYKNYDNYESYKPYNFAYAVKDDITYNDYYHQESQDDKGYVTGSYRVALPDGRHQTVTYTADDYNGYAANVQYAGEAKYPEYKSASYPAYKPSYSRY
ncbi:cuticle protein 19-like [Artemia franciscana]|uniref:cuticle protein 19-like n=1 Tax=Artemia franciscana TaxID=6661 RepID=UPI0032DB308B